MKTIYLCGPIAGCSDSECKDWRENIKSELTITEFETIDPMRRDYRGCEEDCVNEIVQLDKIDIDNSDVVIAYCPKPSVGTSMEIFYAWINNIPVVCVVPFGSPISPWLKYHSTTIVRDFDDALEWIKEKI